MTADHVFRKSLAGLTIVSFTYIAFVATTWNPNERAMRAAAAAFSAHHWSNAQRLADPLTEDSHFGPAATIMAGISAFRQHLDADAERYLSAEKAYSPEQEYLRDRELGRHYKTQGKLVAAERLFRKALKFRPLDIEVNRELSRILSFEGRCEEAAPYLMTMVRAGQFKADELYTLGIPDEIVLSDVRLREQSERLDGSDRIHLLGPCRILMADHKYESAEPQLESIVAAHPEIALAQALLGRILVEQRRWAEATEWLSQLPQDVLDSSYIWFVRGLWARDTDEPGGAVRCFLETLRQNPNHVEANYQLSQLFTQLEQPELAARFSDRSLAISKIGYIVNDLRAGPDPKLLADAVDAFESLGRYWEAAAWCRLAIDFSEATWPQERFLESRKLANAGHNQLSKKQHPLHGLNPESYPLPEHSLSPAELSPATASSDSDEKIRFENVSAAVGVDFQYFNSMNDDIGLEHIFQTTGGGIAAFDFDLDLQPDLFFSNGKVLPEDVVGIDEPQGVHFDQLYRNRGDAFEECHELANIVSDGFGQGVTTGDFDNDGFDDLFIANVGRNRLYRNNGDGTFSEVADSGVTESSLWSMSAMIADVDGDGLSDIYVVNYLDMAEVFDRSCKANGQPLTCAPTLFNAEQDRVYRNNGDGSFADVTDEIGLPHTEGKGLGIVGFRVAEKPGLQIFIANDTTQNLFYESSSEPFRYQENSVLAGLAMSEAGDMQACMGVAAGDADGDGTVDLFVTNFYADSNTMYLQTVPSTFTDATRNCDLAEPSFGLVGFGTQFLDADLDGHLDIVVTNGHVDQTFATGEPDRMRPQFFRNLGQARFAELKSKTLGSFFDEQHFGRSMARLDWNRDGRHDVAILHLDAPVALLENRSERSNSSATLFLVGNNSSRDAIGTTVSTESRAGGDLTWQLTGGDGYQASNEKALIIPFEKSGLPVSLRIEWPDGSVEHLQIEGSGPFMAVQGRAKSLALDDF